MKMYFWSVLTSWVLILATSTDVATARSIHHGKQPAEEDPVAEADRLADEVDKESQKAKNAAAAAKQAAVVANRVAEHSVHIVKHSKKALTHALGALHEARVESQGLDKSQKDSLKKAEAKLREATKVAEFGKLKKVQDAEAIKKQKMQAELERSESKKKSELEQMKVEVRELRRKLKESGGDEQSDKELQELENELERRKNSDKADDKNDVTNDELKAEIERLRADVKRMEEQKKLEEQQKQGRVVVREGSQADRDKELMRDVHMQPLDDDGTRRVVSRRSQADVGRVEYDNDATPIQDKGIDIDTQMPYGDLEPFGREDTAQELTESSVRESDEMVDQLERAEVAEEKRAVFRALTRLRGAAITSFDGIARSQTGNIDEYNKVNKWRRSHPMHHLADEESDISKWAFPDNADLVQLKNKGISKEKKIKK